MSEQIKNGDMVICWDTEGEIYGPNIFIGAIHDNRGIVVFDKNNGVEVYRYCEKAPEPTYNPFDQDTFPKGMVWLFTGDDCRELVISVIDSGVRTESLNVDYDNLLDSFKISTDNCETWQPAGVEV